MKKMLEMLYIYGGFVFIALSMGLTWGADQMLTKPLIERQDGWKTSFAGEVANLLCFNCVDNHMTAMNKIGDEEMQKTARQLFGEIKAEARKLLVWPFALILASLFFEVWRLRRFHSGNDRPPPGFPPR